MAPVALPNLLLSTNILLLTEQIIVRPRQVAGSRQMFASQIGSIELCIKQALIRCHSKSSVQLGSARLGSARTQTAKLKVIIENHLLSESAILVRTKFIWPLRIITKTTTGALYGSILHALFYM